MPYDRDQIANINQRAAAVPRKKYVTDRGEVYIGRDNGRLTKRDIGLSSLRKTVKRIPTSTATTTAAAAVTVYGNKYKTSTITITDTYEYYVHRNFEVSTDTIFTIDSGGQLAVGDGILRNNGTLINNGEVILT